jgi:preprotein translocase subunit SecG
MYEILLIVYLLVSLFLIFLILIQQGKGADMGASFGAGSSNTLFGASGSGNFLTRLTTGLATGFFVLSLVLGNLTKNDITKGDEYENLVDDSATAPLATDVPMSDVPVSDIPSASGDVPASDVPATTDAAKEDDSSDGGNN